MTNKYIIFFVIFLGYGVLSYNRKSVSYTVPQLIKEISNQEVGLIMSAQNMAYAISKFAGGVASDRFSSRTLLSSGLVASALTAFLFAISNSVPLYTFAWFLNGLAQGLGWPAIAKLLKNWFKPEELGLWWSAASASSNLSGVFGPIAAVALIGHLGWRLSLVMAGNFSLLTAAIVYIHIKDDPRAARLAAASPRKKKPMPGSEPYQKYSAIPPKVVVPFMEAMKTLLSRPSIWIIAFCYMSVSCIKTSVSDWGQIYITDHLKMRSQLATTFLATFELGGFWGGIMAGYFSDIFIRNVMRRHAGRLPRFGNPRVFVAMLFAALAQGMLYLLTYSVDTKTPTMLLITIAFWLGVAIFGQIALFGIAATESVATEISGTSHAIAALAANIGSIIAGLPLTYIAKHYTWHTVFQSLGQANVAAIILMFTTTGLNYYRQ